MRFYQHSNRSLIFVEAVNSLYSDDTIYCIHFDKESKVKYIELNEKEFNFFIGAYYEVKITKDTYKKVFCID